MYRTKPNMQPLKCTGNLVIKRHKLIARLCITSSFFFFSIVGRKLYTLLAERSKSLKKAYRHKPRSQKTQLKPIKWCPQYLNATSLNTNSKKPPHAKYRDSTNRTQAQPHYIWENLTSLHRIDLNKHRHMTQRTLYKGPFYSFLFFPLHFFLLRFMGLLLSASKLAARAATNASSFLAINPRCFPRCITPSSVGIL